MDFRAVAVVDCKSAFLALFPLGIALGVNYVYIFKGDILGQVVVKGADDTITSFDIIAQKDIKTNFLLITFWGIIAFCLENTHAAINITIIIILLLIIIKLALGFKTKKKQSS